MNSLSIVVGMAVTTAGSAVSQIILKSLGKIDEAQVMDFTTKCLLIVTACTSFVSAIKSILSLIV